MSLPGVLPQPVNVWRGDSLSIPVRVWSDAAKTVPVDLTGFGSVFTAQARRTFSDTAFVAFAVASSAAITGQLTLSLTPAQTAALVNGAYGFDVQAADAGGTSVTTLLTGELAVSGDFTHA